MKVEKPGERKFVKALIFGPPGHGKTTFIATAQLDERTSPMLYIDFEGGDQSLSGLDIDMVKIRDWRDYDQVYRELASGKTEYKSIGLDSISETHVFALLDILKKEGPNRKDSDQLEQRDYGRATIQMRRLLRSFRDLPMHVFMVAGAKDDVEVRVGTVKKPALSGQLADEVPGMMDVVGYLAKLKERDEESGEDYEIRALLLHGHANFRVKVRTGWGQEAPSDIEEEEPGQFAEEGVSMLLDALHYGIEKPKVKKAKKRRNA